MSEFIAPPPFKLTLRDRILPLDEPQVMGILNVTPDSFFSNSRCESDLRIAERTRQMIAEGARMIDVGAYSTRPGAAEVTLEEELERLYKALPIIREEAPDAVISVDTFRADVARACVSDWGVDIVNDVSGGLLDDAMGRTVAELGVPYVLMHMRGTPETMQQCVEYKKGVAQDVIIELTERVAKLREQGVRDIIVDPGFGFAKTLEQNYELLASLSEFHRMEMPLLVGASRKSMVYKLLHTSPEEALNGTTALHVLALQQGAHILRVHDVREAVEAVRIVAKVREAVARCGGWETSL